VGLGRRAERGDRGVQGPEAAGDRVHQARNIFTVEVPEDSSIQEVTDLRGKKLGITQKGGGEEPLIEVILSENDMKGDVEIVPVGEVGAASARAI
jgi:NitT/TauT family transport system substrate-binding protein